MGELENLGPINEGFTENVRRGQYGRVAGQFITLLRGHADALNRLPVELIWGIGESLATSTTPHPGLTNSAWSMDGFPPTRARLLVHADSSE
jgi:hypothetical protein